MTFCDKILLLSLKRELDILNSTVNSASSKCPSEEVSAINSWMFPSKNYHFVDEIIAGEDIENVTYANYLELIIDRIYAVIRLAVIHIKSVFHPKETTKRIVTPKKISLGTSLEVLWRNICDLTSEKSMNCTSTTLKATKNDGIEVLNRQSQTEIAAINKCDSCASAISCMKNLMQCFEDNDDSDMRNDRQKLKLVFFDITQFGSMMRSTASIEKSVNALFKQVHEKTRENDVLKLENAKLLEKIESKLGSITVLEREVNIFKEKYDQDRIKFIMLMDQKNDLMLTKGKNELKIRSLEEIVQNLNDSIKTYRENYQSLSLEKQILDNKFTVLCENQKTVMEFFSKLFKKLNRIEEEQDLYLDGFLSLQKSVDRLSKNVEKISENSDKIQTKIQAIFIDFPSETTLLTSKFLEFQENVTKLFSDKLQDNSKKIDDSKSFKVEGNPVEDMTKQVEENKQNIQKLMAENLKLEGLIVKLSKFKK